MPQTLTRQGLISNLLLELTRTFLMVMQVSEVWSPSTTAWTTRPTSPGPLALGHRALLSPFALPQVRLLPNCLVTGLVCTFYAHLPGDSLPLSVCFCRVLYNTWKMTWYWSNCSMNVHCCCCYWCCSFSFSSSFCCIDLLLLSFCV